MFNYDSLSSPLCPESRKRPSIGGVRKILTKSLSKSPKAWIFKQKMSIEVCKCLDFSGVSGHESEFDLNSEKSGHDFQVAAKSCLVGVPRNQDVAVELPVDDGKGLGIAPGHHLVTVADTWLPGQKNDTWDLFGQIHTSSWHSGSKRFLENG